MRKNKLFLLSAALLLCISVHATDGDAPRRRWAVNFGLHPIYATASTGGSQYDIGNKSIWGGPNASLQLEYYLPGTKFSLIGGYESEGMDFCNGDVSAASNLLSVGGRWYPCPRGWFVQPYAGANVYAHLNSRHESGRLTVSSSQNYVRDYTIKRPLFSAAPVVGLDLYVFSSMALELEYGYRLAVDGRTKITTTLEGGKPAGSVRSSMHRHAFSVGLKVTFPFKFTAEDGIGLIDSIFNTLEYNKRKSVRRPLIYY